MGEPKKVTSATNQCADTTFEKPSLTSKAAVDANRRLWEDIPTTTTTATTKEDDEQTTVDESSVIVPYGMIIRVEDEIFFNNIDKQGK